MSTLERFMTEAGKGWGIKTKQPICLGEFIMEYVGEIVSDKEFKLRMLTEYVEDTHHYCLHLDGGMAIGMYAFLKNKNPTVIVNSA